MKLKDYTRYVAAPSAVITVLICSLIVVGILQGLTVGIMELADLKMSAEAARATRPTSQSATTSQPVVDPYAIQRAEKAFLPDGAIHLVYAKDQDYLNRGVYNQVKPEDQEVRVTDTQGKLLFEGKRKDLPFKYITWAGGVGSLSFADYLMRDMGMIGVEFSKWLKVPVVSRQDEAHAVITQYWRYVPGDGIFAGFNMGDGRIGYAGANGVHEQAEQVEAFDEFQRVAAWCAADSSSPLLLWLTKSRLYQIDFPHSSIQPLFETGGKEVTRLFADNWNGLRASDSRQPPLLALTTKDGACRILWGQPARRVELELPHKPKGFAFPGTADGKLFIRTVGVEGGWGPPDPIEYRSWAAQYRHRPYKQWTELHEVSEAGQMKLVNRFEWMVPARPVTEPADGRDEPAIAQHKCVLSFSPPLYWAAWQWIVAQPWEAYRGQADSFMPRAMAEVLSVLHPASLAATLAISLAMAAVALWHGWARRTCWWAFSFWLGLVAVFGLAGLLTYLGLNHTPVIRCAACGRKRALQRLTCPACGAEFPKPSPRDVDLVRPG